MAPHDLRLMAAGIAMVGTTFGPRPLLGDDRLAAALCVGGATIAAAALLPPREEIRARAAQPAGA